jgi:hypothetical protein
MATADEQIRVRDQVKRMLDRRRRKGESYNEALGRVPEESDRDFLAGFGRWSDDHADCIREARETEQFVFPSPACAEALVAEGTAPNGDIAEVRADRAWGEVYETDDQTAELAGEVTDEMGPQGPFLTGSDPLSAAVRRELHAALVSADNDPTHPEMKSVLDIEEYREEHL